jgi:hypothetical protein|tara:strand:+ start:86 stop:214 length:129 start_codon:yes stop_codon:yes gene_type:complete
MLHGKSIRCADSGQVRVVAYSFMDIAVRHAESFTALSDIVPT